MIAPAQPGPGCFVAVVGPSGAGKDTLINFARERLAGDARFVFARRVVTRPADAGSEVHDSFGAAEFDAALAAGAFGLNWSAHGLRYGLPIGLDDDIAAGRTVIANLVAAGAAGDGTALCAAPDRGGDGAAGDHRGAAGGARARKP